LTIETCDVTILTHILQLSFSIFHFVKEINHVILSNSGNIPFFTNYDTYDTLSVASLIDTCLSNITAIDCSNA
jgi:hypothetical protein